MMMLMMLMLMTMMMMVMMMMMMMMVMFSQIACYYARWPSSAVGAVRPHHPLVLLRPLGCARGERRTQLVEIARH